MITGDNPLTAVHVARAVEIVDREALILDLKENPAHDAGEILDFPHTPVLNILDLRPRLAYSGRNQNYSR